MNKVEEYGGDTDGAAISQDSVQKPYILLTIEKDGPKQTGSWFYGFVFPLIKPSAHAGHATRSGQLETVVLYLNIGHALFGRHDVCVKTSLDWPVRFGGLFVLVIVQGYPPTHTHPTPHPPTHPHTLP